METNKNVANICGRVRSIEKSHSYVDDKKNVNQFYRLEVEVKRLSETIDYVPVIINERLFRGRDHFPHEGDYIRLAGEIRSRNYLSKDKKKCCEIFFYARTMKYCEDSDYDWTHNIVEFDGMVCKTPNSYKTAGGRIVTKIIVRINKKGRSDRSNYVPVVCFGNWANFAKNLVVKDRISLKGRFQSRNYFRKQEVDNVQYVTHEISCISLESERLGTIELSGPKVVDLNEYRDSKKKTL